MLFTSQDHTINDIDVRVVNDGKRTLEQGEWLWCGPAVLLRPYFYVFVVILLADSCVQELTTEPELEGLLEAD